MELKKLLRFFFIQKKKNLLYDIRKQLLKTLMKIVSSFGNPFLKSPWNRRDDDDKLIVVDVDSSDENEFMEIDNSGDDVPTETAEAELGKCPILLKIKAKLILERLSNDCTSPIYAFFIPTPSTEYINDSCVHIFECSAKSCKGKGNGCLVCRYLDTSDCKSTGNLRKHAHTWAWDHSCSLLKLRVLMLLLRH